jgi:hypothetical protein
MNDNQLPPKRRIAAELEEFAAEKLDHLAKEAGVSSETYIERVLLQEILDADES